MFFTKRPIELPSLENALPGRNHEIDTALNHFVLNTPLKGPIPDGFAEAMFGMGCFWGVERIFWQIEGVWTTAVGYAGGHTPNATYEEVCSGRNLLTDQLATRLPKECVLSRCAASRQQAMMSPKQP